MSGQSKVKRGRPSKPDSEKKVFIAFTGDSEVRELVEKTAEAMGQSNSAVLNNAAFSGFEFAKLLSQPQIQQTIQAHQQFVKDNYGIVLSHRQIVEAILLNHLAMSTAMVNLFNCKPFVLPNFYMKRGGQVLEGEELFKKFFATYKQIFERMIHVDSQESMEDVLSSPATFN